jgi:hypothetical protein
MSPFALRGCYSSANDSFLKEGISPRALSANRLIFKVMQLFAPNHPHKGRDRQFGQANRLRALFVGQPDGGLFCRGRGFRVFAGGTNEGYGCVAETESLKAQQPAFRSSNQTNHENIVNNKLNQCRISHQLLADG